MSLIDRYEIVNMKFNVRLTFCERIISRLTFYRSNNVDQTKLYSRGKELLAYGSFARVCACARTYGDIYFILNV